MKRKAAKQLIESSEAYFTHLGFTLVHEMRKTRKRNRVNTRKWAKQGGGRLYEKLKIRPVVQKRLAKLKRYLNLALS